MHFIIDKDDFIAALEDLQDDDVSQDAIASGEVLSHSWECLACGTQYTAFEYIAAPLPCGCGQVRMVPRDPTLH